MPGPFPAHANAPGKSPRISGVPFTRGSLSQGSGMSVPTVSYADNHEPQQEDSAQFCTIVLSNVRQPHDLGGQHDSRSLQLARRTQSQQLPAPALPLQSQSVLHAQQLASSPAPAAVATARAWRPPPVGDLPQRPDQARTASTMETWESSPARSCPESTRVRHASAKKNGGRGRGTCCTGGG